MLLKMRIVVIKWPVKAKGRRGDNEDCRAALAITVLLNNPLDFIFRQLVFLI
jgi:hypothetical protein